MIPFSVKNFSPKDLKKNKWLWYTLPENATRWASWRAYIIVKSKFREIENGKSQFWSIRLEIMEWDLYCYDWPENVLSSGYSILAVKIQPNEKKKLLFFANSNKSWNRFTFGRTKIMDVSREGASPHLKFSIWKFPHLSSQNCPAYPSIRQNQWLRIYLLIEFENWKWNRDRSIIKLDWKLIRNYL